MELTIFSIFTAAVCSSAIILIQYHFVRKRSFIKSFGVTSMVALYVFCLFRILIPVELGFTQVIANDTLLANLYTNMRAQVSIFGRVIPVAGLMLSIWLSVTVVLSLKFTLGYFRMVSEINKLETSQNLQINNALEKVLDDLGKSMNITVLTSSAIETPIGMGVFKKIIILPRRASSEQDLYYILLHEITHFINKDIPFKILVQFFCFIFWWNPIVYLFRTDLDQVLEIKCDLSVTEGMAGQEKAQYLTAIANVLRGQKNQNIFGLGIVSLVGKNTESSMLERFKIISDCKKQASKRSMKLLWGLIFTSVILLSYSVVLQPRYDPPIEEIITSEDTIEVTKDNSYLVEVEDGSYFRVHESGQTKLISRELADMMIEDGFEIREVNEK